MKRTAKIYSLVIVFTVGCSISGEHNQVNAPTHLSGDTPTPILTVTNNTKPILSPDPLATLQAPKAVITQNVTLPPSFTMTPAQMLINREFKAAVSSQIIDMGLEGIIWMRLNWEAGEFLRIDFNQKEIGIHTVQAPGCYELLFNSTEALCALSGQSFLLNLLTGEKRSFAISHRCWDVSSSNGTFLAYEECGPSNRENQARLLNLDTQDEQTISSFKDNFENRGWESGPILSRDGKHLVVQIPHGIFEIMADGEYKRIDQGDLDIYWDMAWSPVDNVLVYGATDKQLEVGYALTHLFLLDVEQNETMQLFKTGDRSKIIPFLNREVWSPSGKRIVALVEHYPTSTTSTMDLCVITTDPVKADCQQIAGEGKIISDPAWSPDSKYLIYEEYEMIKGSKAIISIMVYSIDTKKIFKLLSFTPEVTYYHDIDNQKMFWRYP